MSTNLHITTNVVVNSNYVILFQGLLLSFDKKYDIVNAMQHNF